MRDNAMEEIYEEVTVFGKRMLFTCARIDPDTVPKGMYQYEVRHDDNMQGIPCQVAKWIMVNHWGTLITNRPIKLQQNAAGSNAYRDIDINDWNYEGAAMTLKEYMERHPPKKERDCER